jgi:hypothetical protein
MAATGRALGEIRHRARTGYVVVAMCAARPGGHPRGVGTGGGRL